MARSGKTGWIAQAVVCLALIAWQIYDFVVPRGGGSLTMTLFNIVVLLFALIGLVGALYALRGPRSTTG